MIELRDFGDKKTIVAFTDDNKIANKLREYKNCFKMVPYEQEQKGKIVIVGIDFYFPKSSAKRLSRVS